MSILLETMFFLALAHFIYESILAPSWRLNLRYELLSLRDALRALRRDRDVRLDEEHYLYLQDSINTMIAMLHRYDVVSIVTAELRFRRDPQFRKRVEVRATILDDCNAPQAQAIRRRSIELIARAIALNSGMFCAPLYPFVLMGMGFCSLRKSLRKFAALSGRELKRIAPERLGVAIH